MEAELSSKGSRPNVWIIGNTVLLEGVEVSLREREITNLVSFDTPYAALDVVHETNKPNVIIFELGSHGSDWLLETFKMQPETCLLGLNLNCNQLLVMNCSQQTVTTMTELSQIVQEAAGVGMKIPKGG